MSRFPGLRRLMRLDRASRAVERAVDDELQFHFDMTMSELMADGMNEDEARREAGRRFGDVRRTSRRLATIDRSRVKQERRAEWWSAVAQDLRYALRGLRLKPGFAAVVVLTLGLGIGANAAMFGIVDRLLFRAPNYLIAPERTHRLYLGRIVDGKEFVGGGAQYQRMLDFARATRTMEMIGAYSQARRAVGSGEATREVSVGAMSANMWRLFDARPLIGRFFTTDEDRYPEISRVAVLSYGYWQSQFAGDRAVVGKTIVIGPASYSIIGVAPRGFAAVDLIAPSMFIPLTASAVDGFGTMWTRYHATYNVQWLTIFARRKPGVTLAAAAADLTEAYRRSWRAQIAVQPQTPSLEATKPHVVVGSIIEQRGPGRSADTRVATWLLGVASIVLLIACANVGNLLLSRAFRRRREIAVRVALGAGRLRLVSQLLIESLLLAVIGGITGLAFAQWGGQVLRSTLVPQVEWASAIADKRVLGFAALCALAAGLLAGLAPIFDAGRTDTAAALKAGAREGHGRRSRVRTALLVLQASLSVVLLIGAGLFVRSLSRVQAMRLGYDADRLIWIEPHMRGVRLDSAQAAALRRDLIARAMQNPIVENATPVVTVPFSATYADDAVAVGVDSARHLTDVINQIASPSYFATVGTRIVRGRGITADDGPSGPLVVVVSETMAKTAWPNEEAIGKCLRLSADTMPCRTVVGVAEDTKLADFNGPLYSMVYIAAEQLGVQNATLYVRVRTDAADANEAVRRDLQKGMPGVSYLTSRPLMDVVSPQMRSWQLGATMFAVFGGLALLLAAVGLYSVIAYSVAQRTHEMGVRIALGARVRDVVGLIVRDGVRVSVAGVALGVIAALAVGRWLAPLLFEVSPRDPIVFTSVAVILLVIALAASWLPAARASRVDPSVALRAE
jgi:predicted permease